MSPEPIFGPLPRMTSAWKVAADIRAEIRAWFPFFLAEYERQHGIEPGKLPKVRTFAVRHAGTVKSAENFPAIIVWLANEPTADPDVDGALHGDIGIGVLVIAEARDEFTSGEVLHAYKTAVRQLLWTRPPAAGHASNFKLVNSDPRGIEVGPSRTLLGIDMSWLAERVHLGNLTAVIPHDAQPPSDPYLPWPDGPTVETAELLLDALPPEATP